MDYRRVGAFIWRIAPLACVGAFVAYAISNADKVPLYLLLAPGHAAAILGAAILCVCAVVLGGCAWYALVRNPGADNSVRVAVLVVLTAQFAKYLPGNVAHLVGRVALARAHGFDTARSVASTAMECCLAVVAAIAVAGVALLLTDWSLMVHVPVVLNLTHVALVGSTVGAGVIAAVLVEWRRPHLRQRLLEWFNCVAPTRSAIAVALGFLILAHVVAGVALQVVAQYVFAVGGGRFPWVLGSMAVAWTAGFVTPGAPGGLGVREALLVGMLAPAFGTAVAVGIALSFRIVTTLGDLIAFAVGFLGQRLLRKTS
jgi:hypothetical protein